MVTYETLFLFGSLVVAIIALVIDITKKEITAPRQKCGYFFNPLLG